MVATKKVRIFGGDMGGATIARGPAGRPESGLGDLESSIISRAHSHQLSTRPSRGMHKLLLVAYSLMDRGYLKLSTDDELMSIISNDDAKKVLRRYGIRTSSSTKGARLRLQKRLTPDEVLKVFPYRYFKLTAKGLAAFSADYPNAPGALPAGTFEAMLEKFTSSKDVLAQSVSLCQAAKVLPEDLAELYSDAISLVYTEPQMQLADTVALLKNGTLAFSNGLPKKRGITALWTLECAINSGGAEEPGWRRFASDIKHVVTLAPVEPVSTEGWFSGLTNLVGVDLSMLDMGRCESAARMFSGCKSLRALDVSDWDMSECWDMTEMFAECENLETLDLFALDVSHSGEASRAGMLRQCQSLKSVDISKWEVDEIDSLKPMFSGCTSLTDVVFPSWDYPLSRIEDVDSPAVGLGDEVFAWMLVGDDPTLGVSLERLGCPHEALHNSNWRSSDQHSLDDPNRT